MTLARFAVRTVGMEMSILNSGDEGPGMVTSHISMSRSLKTAASTREARRPARGCAEEAPRWIRGKRAFSSRRLLPAFERHRREARREAAPRDTAASRLMALTNIRVDDRGERWVSVHKHTNQGALA